MCELRSYKSLRVLAFYMKLRNFEISEGKAKLMTNGSTRRQGVRKRHGGIRCLVLILAEYVDNACE